MSKFKIGEQVMWRGGWGNQPAVPARIIGEGHNTDGRHVYDLDNSHWCYDDQLEPMPGGHAPDEETGEKIVKELNRRGVMAFWEYPGYVSVPMSGGSTEAWCFNFGDGGETWSGNMAEMETGDTDGRPACLFDSLIARTNADVNLLVTEMLGYFAKLYAATTYRCKTCQWFVMSPDELALNRTAFKSEAEARSAIPELIERYRIQGYYKTAECERIPFESIGERCTVRTGVEGVI